MKTLCLVLFSLALTASQPNTLNLAQGRNVRRHSKKSGSSQAAPLTYDAAVLYDTGGSGGRSAAIGDVNGDGKPDLLVVSRCATATGDTTCSSHTEGQVGVMLGNGDGTFQSVVLYDSGAFEARAITLADVNGDGKLDALVTHMCAVDITCGNGTISVLLGNGNGTFQAAVTSDAGALQSFFVAVADVNGDGKPDVVVADRVAVNTPTPSLVSVLLGNGDGTFQTAVTYNGGGIQTYSLTVADFNGDGKPDIAVANYCAQPSPNCNVAGGGSVGVLLGRGDGTFHDVVTYGSGGGFAYAIASADVNHDGKMDVVVANQCVSAPCDNTSTGNIGVLLGKGDGTFQTAVSYTALGNNTDGINIADLNSDGNLDVLVSNYCIDANCASGGADVFLGNGDGTFQAPMSFGSGAEQAYAVTTGDLNGDGLADIVVTNQFIDSAPNDGVAGVLLASNFAVTATPLDPNPIVPGGTATSTITLAPSNGFSHNVNLTCTVAGTQSPAPTCSLNPTTISGASGTATLTVTSIGQSASFVRPGKIFYAACVPLFGLPLMGMLLSSQGSRFRGWMRFLVIGSILAGLVLLTSCGAGNNNNGGGGGGGGCPNCTSVGNYMINVVGTDATNANIKEPVNPALALNIN